MLLLKSPETSKVYEIGSAYILGLIRFRKSFRDWLKLVSHQIPQDILHECRQSGLMDFDGAIKYGGFFEYVGTVGPLAHIHTDEMYAMTEDGDCDRLLDELFRKCGDTG